MALERRDLTQLVTFDPPLPQRAFAIVDQGTTTDAETWGGSGEDGRTFGWLTLDTTWWTDSQGTAGDLNLLPMPVGTRFQFYGPPPATPTAQFNPGSALINAEGAPDLLDINSWLGHAVVPKNTNLRTVVGIRQVNSNQWNVYYSPPGSETYNPGTDGVVTYPEPRDPKWLGTIGHVTGLQMDWIKPGGPNTMQFNLTCPPTYRDSSINLGRRIQAWRGMSCIWEGILEEPEASSTGWTIIADGVGTEGSNYTALYTTWTPDNPVNEAIGRGLRWRNDGIGTPPGLFGLNGGDPGGVAGGNAQDSGSLTVTEFLNLLVTSGSLYWSLEPPMSVTMPAGPWVLRFRQFPTDLSGNPLAAGTSAKQQWNIQEWQRTDLTSGTYKGRIPPDLYLINTSPSTRTTNGVYNTLVCRYQATPDIPGTTANPNGSLATFNELIVDQPSAVAAQGRLEYYLDMTSANVMTTAQVQQIAQNVLNRYMKLAYSNTYTVTPGQLMNNGGVAVDLALDWSGRMCTVLVSNAPVGGDVNWGPLTFFIGDYAYDDDSQTGTVTPYQNGSQDLQTLISQLYPNGFS